MEYKLLPAEHRMVLDNVFAELKCLFGNNIKIQLTRLERVKDFYIFYISDIMFDENIEEIDFIIDTLTDYTDDIHYENNCVFLISPTSYLTSIEEEISIA